MRRQYDSMQSDILFYKVTRSRVISLARFQFLVFYGHVIRQQNKHNRKEKEKKLFVYKAHR